ncbi:30S ribosomal protein S17 [Marinicella pacifica]|jgi:small subunit ribosomal protein S17|uniref:Small ribosomal subunit protein uS17 n=1 Tax=Marinicella pacifica TaxID=1171543 RepID=A0A917FP80_9GAMM|nr:30S ribosomal protein S17 [Marinicella pacifica]GGF97097.1 30S ribosomal protein S17 [Marinicella pacifica]
MATETNKIRTKSGLVTSNKMDQTVTVLIERTIKHPLYKKYIKKSTKIHAHDADNKCQEGDIVKIAECRPISKTKSWKVVEIVTSND